MCASLLSIALNRLFSVTAHLYPPPLFHLASFPYHSFWDISSSVIISLTNQLVGNTQHQVGSSKADNTLQLLTWLGDVLASRNTFLRNHKVGKISKCAFEVCMCNWPTLLSLLLQALHSLTTHTTSNSH